MTAATADPTAVSFQAAPETGSVAVAPSEQESRFTGWNRWSLVLAVAILGTGVGASRWWVHARAHVVTDNAYIAGNIHQISARVAGTVTEVAVSDNVPVQAGDKLLVLDPRDLEVRVDQARHALGEAEAQLLKTDAQLEQAQAQRAQADAKLVRARAELERAGLDLERARRLTEGGRYAAISKQEVDGIQAAFSVAQASVEVAAAEQLSSQGFLKAAHASHSVAENQLHLAQVNLADAKLQRSYADIAAPVAGKIGRKNVEVGQRIQPGQPLLAIVADQKWIVANFKETQLARMQPGQSVAIRVDAIPGKSFPGRIESFSPASGAQFALLPPDNATGNFTKIVQRVPVKIVFDPAGVQGFECKLAPGLSAVVDVHLDPRP